MLRDLFRGFRLERLLVLLMALGQELIIDLRRRGREGRVDQHRGVGSV